MGRCLFLDLLTSEDIFRQAREKYFATNGIWTHDLPNHAYRSLRPIGSQYFDGPSRGREDHYLGH